MAINKDDTFLTKEHKETCKCLLEQYSLDNFEEPLTGLQASILVDFIDENLGKYFYNQGVEDSIIAIKEKADDLFLIMKD